MPEQIKEEKLIGEIIHYFGKIGVAVIRLSDTLRLGDTIKIVGGEDTEFTQEVESMEIDHQKIEEAKPGDDVGLKVIKKVREGYKVYKV